MTKVHTLSDLKQMQSLPLHLKVALTKSRIREWIRNYDSYISFSGGKDSTVLLDIVRQVDKNVVAVFSDTGLEYPEIRDFVKKQDNVIIIKPKMNFRCIIDRYGYPLFSKEISQKLGGGIKSLNILKKDGINIFNESDVFIECVKRYKKMPGEWYHLAQCMGWVTKNNGFKISPDKEEISPFTNLPKKYKVLLNAPFNLSDICCKIMKKEPFDKFTKETGKYPLIGTMTEESKLRENTWLKHGCNMWNAKKPKSNPLSFWTEQDILLYIKERNIEICSVYGDIVEDEKTGKLRTTGCNRTGCMFCGYGCQFKGFDKFVLMKETHSKQYEWIMKDWESGGLGYGKILQWINSNTEIKINY